MTTLSHFHVVCYQGFCLSDFYSFTLGHGTCKRCLAESNKNFRRRELACVVCRRPYKADEAHHLYLTIDDAKIVSASTTVEKMAEMDSDSKLISVKTAGERVKRASETLACPCHEDIAVRN
jgi:hypothetical protein